MSGNPADQFEIVDPTLPSLIYIEIKFGDVEMRAEL